MSTHRTEPPASSAELEARVAAELRALGEPELAPDELAATPYGAVLATFALAHPPELAPAAALDRGDDALGEFAQHRVWRKVAARMIPAAPRTAAPRTLRAAWVAVATAAGIALVPLLGPQLQSARHDAGDRAAAVALRDQARAALELVPGTQDRARAREYADRYAERLRGDTVVR